MHTHLPVKSVMDQMSKTWCCLGDLYGSDVHLSEGRYSHREKGVEPNDQTESAELYFASHSPFCSSLAAFIRDPICWRCLVASVRLLGPPLLPEAPEVVLKLVESWLELDDMVNGLVNEILGQSDAGVSSAMFYLKSKHRRMNHHEAPPNFLLGSLPAWEGTILS